MRLRGHDTKGLVGWSWGILDYQPSRWLVIPWAGEKLATRLLGAPTTSEVQQQDGLVVWLVCASNQRVRFSGRCRFWRQPSKVEVGIRKELRVVNLFRYMITATDRFMRCWGKRARQKRKKGPAPNFVEWDHCKISHTCAMLTKSKMALQVSMQKETRPTLRRPKRRVHLQNLRSETQAMDRGQCSAFKITEIPA